MVGICEYAASIIVGDNTWSQDGVNTEIVGELLDLDIDDNMDYPTFKAMVEQHISESPEYGLLVCAYASTDGDDNGYWRWEWNSGKQCYEYLHKPNDDLDRLYDFLISLGYEMSDEEKAMRDGTHQLLSRRDA